MANAVATVHLVLEAAYLCSHFFSVHLKVSFLKFASDSLRGNVSWVYLGFSIVGQVRFPRLMMCCCSSNQHWVQKLQLCCFLVLFVCIFREIAFIQFF